MGHHHAIILASIAVSSIPLSCCNTIREQVQPEERAPSAVPSTAPRSTAETAAAGPAKGPHGLSKRAFQVAGEARSVAFWAPTRRTGKPPLVIAFHGTSGNAAEWVDGHDASGLESLADQHGFVVAAPDSRFVPLSDWDHEYDGGDKYWETAAPRGQDPNANPDLRLVSTVIASSQTTYGVDPKRVYVLGFSNGGFFALLTAMVLRDKIAAFAEAGSGLVTCPTTRSCKAQSTATECGALLRGAAGCSCSGAEKPVPIPTTGRLVPGLLGHNNRDDVVSSVYTCALHRRMKSLGYDVEVMIGNAEGHGVPEEFLPRAWSFFAARRLP